ncbi:hypothetical protein [Pseudonocardia sp. NPDC049154]|uniref:hypothetical protein n=1 Tax=Pseudonocardia sp. NPDC049154 TaxID=3155501 RepID=UPI0033DC62C6
MTSPNERALVTLRVVSPCEHGVEHDILELSEGAVFSFPACKDSRGNPRYHVADATHYPRTVRRR